MPPSETTLLLGLEHRRLRALVEGDLEVAEQLHADDYELITPGGDVLSKRQYLDGIASGDLRYRVFEVASEVAVKAFDDVGMVRYLARIEIDFPDRRDGGTFWHTDIYERRNGKWLVVWSQGTEASGTP
jgi:Domain of unknown function (DUF4440)